MSEQREQERFGGVEELIAQLGTEAPGDNIDVAGEEAMARKAFHLVDEGMVTDENKVEVVAAIQHAHDIAHSEQAKEILRDTLHLLERGSELP